MGLGRKLVRAATPRSARRAMHPVRSLRIAATPRSVRSASYVVYSVRHPLGVAESRIISAGKRAIGSGSYGSHTSASSEFESEYFTGTGVRAEEGADSAELVEQLMSVGRHRFEPTSHITLTRPERFDPGKWRKQEWHARKAEAPFWAREKRLRIKAEVEDYANLQADLATQEARKRVEEEQLKLDNWWQRLNEGDSETVRQALTAAFSDNVAEVGIREVKSSRAVLALAVPSINVLPDKRLNITPTGRLSSKAWSNAEKNEAYARLIGAHLLATLRETWAVAPSVNQIRVIGFNMDSDIEEGFVFDLDAERSLEASVDDEFGEVILDNSPLGLNRVGKSRIVQNWPHSLIRPFN